MVDEVLYSNRCSWVLLTQLERIRTGATDVDNAVAILHKCMVDAAPQALPKKHKRSGTNTFPRNPRFNAECKAAKRM